MANRPPCSTGHRADVWLDGFYGQREFHERPRFVCVPAIDPRTKKRPPYHADGSKPHKFIEALPRRYPTNQHPHGPRSCAECEHVLDRHEEPQTSQRQLFSIREAAQALVAVGEGASLRKASQRSRRSAHRLVTDRWGVRGVSRHDQLSADQLAMFGVLIRDELMPDRWPDAVALDDTSYDLILTNTDSSGNKVSHAASVSILGVYGYPAGRGSGRAIRLAARGGIDRIEWEAVLRSREGEPSWVVCDQGKGVVAAIKRAWPNTTIYMCEAHLRMLGEQRLAADGHDRFGPLWTILRKAIPDRDAWVEFEDEVRAASADQTLDWITKTRPLMQRQWAIRDPDRPLSIGGLETVFQEIIRRLGYRRFVFRNQRRLELVVDLMALDLSGEASDLRYREIIRRHLISNGGQPEISRRALDDRDEPSLHRTLREVGHRLAWHRQQNREAQRRWLARQKRPAGSEPTPPRVGLGGGRAAEGTCLARLSSPQAADFRDSGRDLGCLC